MDTAVLTDSSVRQSPGCHHHVSVSVKVVVLVVEVDRAYGRSSPHRRQCGQWTGFRHRVSVSVEVAVLSREGKRECSQWRSMWTQLSSPTAVFDSGSAATTCVSQWRWWCCHSKAVSTVLPSVQHMDTAVLTDGSVRQWIGCHHNGGGSRSTVDTADSEDSCVHLVR